MCNSASGHNHHTVQCDQFKFLLHIKCKKSDSLILYEMFEDIIPFFTISNKSSVKQTKAKQFNER